MQEVCVRRQAAAEGEGSSLIPRTVPGAVPEHNRAALQRRWSRIRPILLASLILLPICQLGIMAGLFASVSGPPAAFLAIVPAIATIVVLVQLRRGSLLLTPSEWRFSALLVGLLSIPFLLIPLLGSARSEYLTGGTALILVAAMAIPLVCLLLVVQARRILLSSPKTVIAASDFRLVYPIRCERWSADFTLDKERLTWQAMRNTIRTHAGGPTQDVDVQSSFPLSAVLDTSVRVVRDTENGKVWMRGHLWKLSCPPGPGLVLHTRDGEWVLPINKAHELKPIILARANHVRASRARPENGQSGRP